MDIQSFIVNASKKSLTIIFVNGKSACLSVEYLRVFTPKANSSAKPEALVTHKKAVTLTTIENVGKHGYRLIFDDKHNDIYSAQYLILLIKEYKQRWQHYLTELKASGHSREVIIDITQL